MEIFFRVEFNLFGMFLAAIIIILFYYQIKIKTKEDKVFITTAIITLLELILDMLFWLIDGRLFLMSNILNYFVNTIYYLLQILQCFVFMLYVRMHMGYQNSTVKLQLFSAPLILGSLLVITNIFHQLIFTIDSNNGYHRAWGIYGIMYACFCLFYIVWAAIMIIYIDTPTYSRKCCSIWSDEESGGTIWISSDENDIEYQIIVQDDGIGYDVMQKKEDNRTHIGIDNVRKRLWGMCQGTLEIMSEPGNGTKATIKIPKI